MLRFAIRPGRWIGTVAPVSWCLAACCFVGCQPSTLVPATGEKSGEGGETKASPVSTVSAASSGVAIVDLGEIVRQMGANQKWQAEMATREAELNDRLELLKMSFEKELETAKAQYGETPSEDEELELQKMTARYNASILQEREHAQREYLDFQAGLESEFKGQIKPVALRVARREGYAVVMQTTDVLEFDASVDITIKVIEELEAMPEFVEAIKSTRERVSKKLPGGGSFRPTQQ